ncbi:MAG: hypothetical protein Q9164_002953 [Protoblastenia rupestris]
MADDLWNLAAAKLNEKDKSTLKYLHTSTGKPSDLLAAVEGKKEECKKRQWAIRRSGGKDAIILRDVFSKIATWIQKFVEAGDVASNYDPGHAALPWAGVRFLLKDVQQYAAAMEGLERVVKLMTWSSIIEKLYHDSSSEEVEQLKLSLIETYESVLRYLVKAYRYFSKSTADRALSNVLSFHDKFQEHHLAMRAQEAETRKCLSLVAASSRKSVESNLESLSITVNSTHQRLVTLLEDLSKPINRMEAGLLSVNDHLDRDRRLKVLNWFSSLPYKQYHAQAYSEVLPGTGKWFTQDQRITEWRTSSNSSILWLRGPPGFGKSKLLSIVNQQLLDDFTQMKNPAPVFFYCARNSAEPERAKPVAVLASIVRQLCCLEIGGAILHPALKTYEVREDDNFSAGTLTVSESVSLIVDLVEYRPLTTLVIDALDECHPATRFELLHALSEILQKSHSLIKILVSSRDDRDIICHLEGCLNVVIQANNNGHDINQFVHSEVDKMILTKRLLWGNVSQELERLIKQTLCEQAHGM